MAYYNYRNKMITKQTSEVLYEQIKSNYNEALIVLQELKEQKKGEKEESPIIFTNTYEKGTNTT